MRKVEASTASLSSGEGKKAIDAGDLDKELGPAEKKRFNAAKKTSYRKESKVLKFYRTPTLKLTEFKTLHENREKSEWSLRRGLTTVEEGEKGRKSIRGNPKKRSLFIYFFFPLHLGMTCDHGPLRVYRE